MVWIAYSNSLSIEFNYDDTHTIESNPSIRSLSNLPSFFTDPRTFSYRPENSLYRPMATTAVAAGYAISGLETWGYHLIKLIEHCLVVILLFFVILQLLEFEKNKYLIAGLSSAVFAINPANTETVNYICAISSLQAGLFFILSFFLYLKYRSTKKLYYVGFSLLSYALAMLSKEEGITLVAVIFFYELVVKKEKLKEIVKKTIPFGILALLFLIVFVSMETPEIKAARGTITSFQYFVTQIRAWLHYWTLFFLPINLNADNLSFGFSTLGDYRVWVSLFIQIIFVGLIYKSKNKCYWFALLWMYVTILPASSVFPLVEPVTEHRTYVPYMMLSFLSMSLLVGWSKKITLRKNVWIKAGVVSVVFLLLGFTTFQRNKIWQKQITLWEDNLSKNPESIRAMNILGVAYMTEAKKNKLIRVQYNQKALELFEKCHRVAPEFAPCIVHLNIIYSETKHFSDAKRVLEEGLSIYPDYPHLTYYMGLYYKDHAKDYQKAKNYFLRTIASTSGKLFYAKIKLAELELENHHDSVAAQMIAEAIDTDSANPDAWELWAKYQMLQGRHNEAEQIFLRLAEENPNARFFINLANLYERHGEFKKALAYYKKASLDEPTSIQSWKGQIHLLNVVNRSVAQDSIDHSIEKMNLDHAQTMLRTLENSRNFEEYTGMFLGF